MRCGASILATWITTGTTVDGPVPLWQNLFVLDFDEWFRSDVCVAERPREVEIHQLAAGGTGSVIHVGDSAAGDLYIGDTQWFAGVGGDLPYDVLFEVVHSVEESRCDAVVFLRRPDRPEQVTAAGVRRVPIGSLIRQAREEAPVAYGLDPNRGYVPVDFRSPPEAVRESMDEFVAGRFRRTPSSVLRHVAEVYRDAVRRGVPPTKAVEQQLRLPNRDVAKKWVQRARKAGLLEPAPGERKGGLRSE
jgi:hypothetical protein